MDEYIIDAIGVGFGSDKERELSSFIREQTNLCMHAIADAEVAIENYLACAKAMYLFGMTYEMNQLGMM